LGAYEGLVEFILKRLKYMAEKTHTTIGKVSLILGTISFLLMISVPIVPYITGPLDILIVLGFILYLVVLPGAIIAIILGFIARKQGDKYGLVGLILGLVVIILFIISIVLSAIVYVYVSGMLPNPPPST